MHRLRLADHSIEEMIMNQERRNTSTARTLKILATTYARTSHAGGCVGSDSISDSTR